MTRRISSSMFLIIISFSFISCSSLKDKENDNDYSWVKNEDFKKPKEVRYSLRDDYYHDDIINNRDSLRKETAAKLPPKEIKKNIDHQNILVRGIALCYSEEYEEGLKKMKEIYPYYKKNPSYWNQVGSCYFLKGNMRKALLFYNKAKGLNAKFIPPLNNLGVIYQRGEKDQKSLLAYQKALEVNPFSLTPMFNLIQLQLKYGMVGDSKLSLQKLYKKSPLDQDLINMLAYTYLSQGDYQRAVFFYEKISKEKLKKASFGINYALGLKFLNQTEAALRVFSQVDQRTLGVHGDYYNDVRSFLGGS